MCWSRFMVVVVVAVAGSGCLGVRPGIRQSLDEYARPSNWQKLREPAQELAEAMTKGVIDGVAEAVNDKRIAAAIDMYVTAFTHTVSRELGSELGPEIQRQVRGMVGAVVQDLLAQPVLDRMEMMVDRITHVAIAGLGQETARLLTTDLGPAIATVIERQLGPAMRSVIEQVGPAMASTVRDQLAVAIGQSLDRELGPRLVSLSERSAEAAAHGLVRGSIDELRPKLSELTALGERGLHTVSWIVPICTFAILSTLLAVLLVLKHHAARRGYAALELVVSNISDMRDDESVKRLLECIRYSGNRNEGGNALSSFLRKRPELRARPGGPPVPREPSAPGGSSGLGAPQ